MAISSATAIAISPKMISVRVHVPHHPTARTLGGLGRLGADLLVALEVAPPQRDKFR